MEMSRKITITDEIGTMSLTYSVQWEFMYKNVMDRADTACAAWHRGMEHLSLSKYYRALALTGERVGLFRVVDREDRSQAAFFGGLRRLEFPCDRSNLTNLFHDAVGIVPLLVNAQVAAAMQTLGELWHRHPQHVAVLQTVYDALFERGVVYEHEKMKVLGAELLIAGKALPPSYVNGQILGAILSSSPDAVFALESMQGVGAVLSDLYRGMTGPDFNPEAYALYPAVKRKAHQ